MYQSQQPESPPAAGAAGPSTGGGQPESQFFPTRNHLPEATRVDLVQRLNHTLADATVLLTHAKFAHWNVKGMSFWGLHELFDELASALEDHIDMLAERITALGGQAMGTAGMAVSNCRLPAMPTNAASGEAYVDLLAERLAIHDANLYDDIQTADGYGDPDTADLLNEISRAVTQYLWFLDAHLQTQPITPGQTGGQSPAYGESTMAQQPAGQQSSGYGP